VLVHLLDASTNQRGRIQRAVVIACTPSPDHQRLANGPDIRHPRTPFCCPGLAEQSQPPIGRAPHRRLAIGGSQSRLSWPTASGRPETAGSPDCSPQTGRSDLSLNVSKVASISPTWAPANRRAFICRGTALAERVGVAATDKRRWTKPPPVLWCAGLLGNVSFRRRWRGRCEGSAGPSISLRQG